MYMYTDDVPPQMKILNMVIPIIMHFCSLSQIGVLQAAYNPTSSNEIWCN